MDLHLTAATPTEEERRAVDGLLGPEPVPNDRVVRGGHETRADRTLLLPVLVMLAQGTGQRADERSAVALKHYQRRTQNKVAILQ